MMNNVPSSIQWRGKTIYLRGVTDMLAADGKPYAKYEYGIESETKAYFYDFGRGIDWEAEQAGNSEANKPAVRAYSTNPHAVYVRDYRKKKRAALALILNSKLVASASESTL